MPRGAGGTSDDNFRFPTTYIPEGRGKVFRVVAECPADARGEILLAVERQAVGELEEEFVRAVPRADDPLAHRQGLRDRRAQDLAHLDGCNNMCAC